MMVGARQGYFAPRKIPSGRGWPFAIADPMPIGRCPTMPPSLSNPPRCSMKAALSLPRPDGITTLRGCPPVPAARMAGRIGPEEGRPDAVPPTPALNCGDRGTARFSHFRAGVKPAWLP
jgi:hypothetical protein